MPGHIDTKISQAFEKFLLGGRLIIVVAVVGSLISALLCMVAGGVASVSLAHQLITERSVSSEANKLLAVHLIELIDLFLLGTVFYIIATGLYSLFINERIKMVSWLEIHSFDALKSKLIGVVVVLLAVTFLGNVVLWKGGIDIIYLGGAVGLVLGALAILLNFGDHKPDDHPLR